ncbi:hypothetical protein [Paracoccus sp. (in: a-proteobacteria)]|uniref:hypothetical protein n=1 Tax=Paracoccus sp. TaxID=267 RepID=UPI0028ADF48F|nr:hypothetical protein [Paracoccus sp. (in: a-proteobacteria)]
MSNLLPLSRPMGVAALTEAAESIAKQSLALTDLARSVAAYEAATGVSIVVVDAHQAEPEAGVLDETAKAAVRSSGIDFATNPDETAIWDALNIKSMDVGSLRIVPEDLAAARDIAEAIEEAESHVAKQAPSVPEPMKELAAPRWQGRVIPANLIDAVTHIGSLSVTSRWGLAQDLDMIERAIDGQTEKLIADVMEFSTSHIRQRFNRLMDRTQAHGNRFTREQIKDALRFMTGDESAF